MQAMKMWKAQEVDGGMKEEKEEKTASTARDVKDDVIIDAHPHAFDVYGPRHLSFPTWKDLVKSKWTDVNYKRIVLACFVQAVYLLELDRQENRTEDDALAPKWWLPFKYKVVKTLIDERDGSIFGAILEWDRAAALADFILMRPNGAPKAVLALRGTLLKGPTIRRDLEDDLRYFAWESLKGSVRFNTALGALKSATDKYGIKCVCIAGHSLGAGFALQVGKELAKKGTYVEAHLFNPPSLSIAMSLKGVGEKAVLVWQRFRSAIAEKLKVGVGGADASSEKWIPHLYVNDSDYICCYYTDKTRIEQNGSSHGRSRKNVPLEKLKGSVSPKLFVLSKENQKFLDAHRLEKWWADDLELKTAIHTSKLITRQLKSLYNHSPSPSPEGSVKRRRPRRN